MTQQNGVYESEWGGQSGGLKGAIAVPLWLEQGGLTHLGIGLVHWKRGDKTRDAFWRCASDTQKDT